MPVTGATAHILPQNIDSSNFSMRADTSTLTSCNLRTISTEGLIQGSLENKSEDTNTIQNYNKNNQEDDNDSSMNDLIDNYTIEIETEEDMTLTPSATLIKATPVTCVAMMDFEFKPATGEIYQVNSQGHLLKLSLKPGTVYQVDHSGLLQEVLMPIPLRSK